MGVAADGGGGGQTKLIESLCGGIGWVKERGSRHPSPAVPQSDIKVSAVMSLPQAMEFESALLCDSLDPMRVDAVGDVIDALRCAEVQ